jgi:hypothetical protein
MAGVDPSRVEPARDADESGPGTEAVPDNAARGEDDPVASAASMIADQALSIFEAVEAKASEIDARAQCEADEIRREAMAVAAPAAERLDGITRELDAISTALERVSSERAGGRP